MRRNAIKTKCIICLSPFTKNDEGRHGGRTQKEMKGNKRITCSRPCAKVYYRAYKYIKNLREIKCESKI